MTQSYKTGREMNSPGYRAGLEDGADDARRAGLCPPQPPAGKAPPNPEYRRMYDRGYDDAFAQAVPHICTEKCKK